jgi:hypothetical protein
MSKADDIHTYSVSDSNSSDDGLTFAEAVERIEEWYVDADEWATGEGDDDTHEAIADAIQSVKAPVYGGIDELQRYADAIREAVAGAMGGEDFSGHGSYRVSAADGIGLSLAVAEE